MVCPYDEAERYGLKAFEAECWERIEISVIAGLE